MSHHNGLCTLDIANFVYNSTLDQLLASPGKEQPRVVIGFWSCPARLYEYSEYGGKG